MPACVRAFTNDGGSLASAWGRGYLRPPARSGCLECSQKTRRQAVLLDDLGDDVSDDDAGVEGCLGILEDHLYLVPEPPEAAALRFTDALAAEDGLLAGGFFEAKASLAHP
jgi:hypothetical protein